MGLQRSTICLTCGNKLKFQEAYCSKPCFYNRNGKSKEDRKQIARDRAKSWYQSNKEQGKANARKSAIANPEQVIINKRRSHVRRYGLSLEDFEAKAAAQGGVCAICSNPPQNPSLSIDHDHKTNKVRALLCEDCNHGLGNFKDNPSTLRLAALYLEAYGK